MKNRPPLTEEQKKQVDGNIKLAYWFADRYRPDSLDHEEAISACMEGLIRAAQLFDPEKGSYSGYAVRWMRHFCQARTAENHRDSILGGTKWRFREKAKNLVNVDCATNISVASYDDCFSDLSAEKADAKTIVGDLMDKLRCKEKIVMEMLMAGHKYAEVGERLGISIASVEKERRSAMSRMKEIIKNAEGKSSGAS